MKPPTEELFDQAGDTIAQIDVKISVRIIQLFSEGLYSSSHKAVEELVSNSFDAGAENVHVILSADLRDADATIVVVDDGEGMNVEALRSHWIIGNSSRRKGSRGTGRKPIGKFGIGKLSTFVLASKLTHICKVDGTYYAATMDYNNLASILGDESAGVFTEETIKIPVRRLTEKQALKAVQNWAEGDKEGYKALRLFGEEASDSWTVSIMSNLKDLGKKISIGRLDWVLRTAMPQRDDFKLFLDGDPITSPVMDAPFKKMVLGKDVIQMSPPCPEELIAREDKNEPKDSMHRSGVLHEKLLGRITGYIETFDNELDAGKEKFGQSNGFFVYVFGRQVNVDDPGFGIERNKLRHGTFSRFRMVVHIDSLDEALRSSRESFQQGDLYKAAQNYLRAGFNLARNILVDRDRAKTPAARISTSISAAPGSMTLKPLLTLARLVAERKATPFYYRFPTNLSDKAQAEFLEKLKQKSEEDDGLLRSTELSSLDSKGGLAIFDVEQGVLQINSSHPFFAAFQGSFTHPQQSLPLEMLVMSEILIEAHLYQMGVDEKIIRDVIGRREELLRLLVRSSRHRTPGMIALALLDARNNEHELEIESRAAFEAIGFDNVIHIGGSGNPDGTAEAYLPADKDGNPQRYKVGIEAKSGKYVSAKDLGVSDLALHMEDHNCDHHVVVGNAFATSRVELSNSVRAIRNNRKATGRTITLIYIDDLARLVKIASAKRIGGLRRIQELFKKCITPDQSKTWIDSLEDEETEDAPYREILETVWQIAKQQPDELVEYAAIRRDLMHREPPLDISKADIKELSKAMHVLARGVVYAWEESIEINRRPDLILQDIRNAVGTPSKEGESAVHI